jgi:hypothetical protein
MQQRYEIRSVRSSFQQRIVINGDIQLDGCRAEGVDYDMPTADNSLHAARRSFVLGRNPTAAPRSQVCRSPANISPNDDMIEQQTPIATR